MRAYIDAGFLKSASARFPDFLTSPPKSWAGLTRGTTLKKSRTRTGPSIFMLINYQSDRDRVFPLLAWSASANLPEDSEEEECQRLLRTGADIRDVLSRPSGLLDPSQLPGGFPNCFVSSTPLFSQSEGKTFLADQRVRSFLQLYVDFPLSAQGPVPSPGEPGATFFSYEAVAGLAPDLMTEESLKAGYGSILEVLDIWLEAIEPLVRLKEAQGAA